MGKKCPCCGACQECGAQPSYPYPAYPWRWPASPVYPNTYPTTSPGPVYWINQQPTLT